MEQVNWDLVKLVDEVIEPTKNEGDWLDALGVALDLIHTNLEAGADYQTTQIIYFTSFGSAFRCTEKTLKAYIAALLDKKIGMYFVGSNVTEDMLGDKKEKMSKAELIAFELVQRVNLVKIF